jgi:hypothetical protein
MYFGIIILLRILFAASMVFIIGYVFGSFSKKPVLKTITKIAVILTIVLFIAGNIFLFRFGGWHHGNYYYGRNGCEYIQKDSVMKR